MSVLSKQQRDVIRVDTGIHPLVIDRVADAYDSLLRDDVEGYTRYMATALAQQGLPYPIPDKERPTAVDKVKTICIRAIADQKHWSFQRTARWLHAAASR